MARRPRGARVAQLSPLLITLALLAACTPVASTPSPTAASPSPSPRLPTPVPTLQLTPAPTNEPEPVPAGLVIRFTSCSHTCGPSAGTTILDDGRIIWTDNFVRPIESQLTPEALERVRQAIDVRPLDGDGDYQAELRPGAEPIGRGATLHRFEVLHGDRRIVVTFGDPDSYADEPELWIIPPEMVVLSEIAHQLGDPVAWLGESSFAEEPHPYEPERYLIVIDLFTEVGETLGFDADVDDVEWPFGTPIEGAGEPVDGAAGGLGTRCLLLTAAEGTAMIAAEKEAGAARFLPEWRSSVEYRWKRAVGFVQVFMTPLLPHETGSCVNLASDGP